GDTIPELVFQIMSVEPPSMRSLRPDVPEEFERIVMKCLAKERGRRYQNIAELATALAECAPERAKISVERVVAILGTAGHGSIARAEDGLSEPPAWLQTTWSRKRGRGVVFALIGLAIAAAVAFFVLREKEPELSNAKPPPPVEALQPKPSQRKQPAPAREGPPQANAVPTGESPAQAAPEPKPVAAKAPVATQVKSEKAPAAKAPTPRAAPVARPAAPKAEPRKDNAAPAPRAEP